MKLKIIFFINSIQQQRCIKRIEEFIANGYDVEAFGFSRADVIPTMPENFKITILNQFSDQVSYAKRIRIMYKSMRPIFKQHAKENVIYYYFLLDVAIVGQLLNRHHHLYIYEESDLMQTYLPSAVLRKTLNIIDKHIIQRSILTTMTSEGFAQYHYGNIYPSNIVFVPNRLNKKVLQLSYTPSIVDTNHLRIGFVGGARYDTVLNFARTYADKFPKCELHFYGTISDHQTEFEQIINKYQNIYYHGTFSNPTDLPSIYHDIDLVLATYDTQYENVRYAEPNKLYEAAYFQTPIIVSKGTLLASKVQKWGIGYTIDAMNDDEIIHFIQHLTTESISQCISNCRKIDKQLLINENPELFKKLNALL